MTMCTDRWTYIHTVNVDIFMLSTFRAIGATRAQETNPKGVCPYGQFSIWSIITVFNRGVLTILVVEDAMFLQYMGAG